MKVFNEFLTHSNVCKKSKIKFMLKSKSSVVIKPCNPFKCVIMKTLLSTQTLRFDTPDIALESEKNGQSTHSR